MRDIIFLKPVFKQMLWGGSRMRSEFGYDIPGDDTGECWAVSAHKNGDCGIIDGEFEGKTLSWLWENRRGLFGNMDGEVFPLLTKIIDARLNLSIQVHPDDVYAKEHENGSLGKTECWYILDCDPGATIIIGHNARTREELADMIHEGRWSEFIREVPVKKGDFLQIYPGTVHAIKGGTMILETQQNSDITYRVYDYDRLQNGKPRQLHVSQSIDVITVPASTGEVLERGEALEPAGSNRDAVCESLIRCSYYQVWKVDVASEADYMQDKNFLICSCIEGSGKIDGLEIAKGDHFIIPAGYGEFNLEGRMSFIMSAPVCE